MVLATLLAFFIIQLDGPTEAGTVVHTYPIRMLHGDLGPTSIFPSIEQNSQTSSVYQQELPPASLMQMAPGQSEYPSTPTYSQPVDFHFSGYHDANFDGANETGPASIIAPPVDSTPDPWSPVFFETQHQSKPRLAQNPLSPKRREGPRGLNLTHLFGRRMGSDFGLGCERVMYAPMVMDTAISSSYAGFRIRFDRGLASPDRLEYLWAKAGRGPGPETRVDLIDTVYRTELGNAQAALISEIGMRALNPEVNSNTVGFGDMVLGGKALVYDGRCTKISSIFLSYLNTGPTQRGLGTGHVSLEPGMLLRHQWSDFTFLHSEIKYRLPIAGSAGFAGDVLTTGFGLSTIWRESDRYALMPTVELQTHSFLFGSETLDSGTIQRVDGITALDVFPGMRLAYAKSAMGSWEIGVAGGLTFADRDWFDSRVVLDLRWIR